MARIGTGMIRDGNAVTTAGTTIGATADAAIGTMTATNVSQLL
jgi:hypothetical protein